MAADNTEPPEATADELPEAEDVGYLHLGPPFAIAQDCDLVPDPGCHATVACECGQVFRANLLITGFPRCPQCDLEYTTVLLVALRDDDTMVNAFMEHVLGANGLQPAGDAGDGDEGDDDEGDEGDGDEGDDDEGDEGDGRGGAAR